MPAFRTLAVALTATILAACGAGVETADASLCSELERVVRDLAVTDPPVSGPDRLTHEHKVLASHLLIAANDGGMEGRPAPELATVIRDTGRRGTSGSGPEFVAALEESFAACEDAGASMDRDVLTALTSKT